MNFTLIFGFDYVAESLDWNGIIFVEERIFKGDYYWIRETTSN